MWGQLAGKIGQNLKENAGELLNVVAPPGSDEEYTDEEYEDEYEEYTDDEEEETVELDHDEAEESNKEGFGALLGRLIDKEEEEHEEQEHESSRPSILGHFEEHTAQVSSPEPTKETIKLDSEKESAPIATAARRQPPPPPPPKKHAPSAKLIVPSSAKLNGSAHQHTYKVQTEEEEEAKKQREAEENERKQIEKQRQLEERKKEEQRKKEEMERQQHEKERQQYLKMKEDEKKRKAELERQEQEERRRREEEIARKKEDEERERIKEEALRQQEEEERKRKAAEALARQLEEDRKRQEEIARQQEEERRRREVALKKQQEERKRKEAEDLERQLAEETRKKAEEEKKRQEAEDRKRQIEEERTLREAELKRKEAENRNRREAEELERQKEEERRREEEKRQQQEAERKRQQAEIAEKEEANRKMREATAKQEEERRRQKAAEKAEEERREHEAEEARKESQRRQEEQRRQEIAMKEAQQQRYQENANAELAKLRSEMESVKAENDKLSDIQRQNRELEQKLKETSQQLIHAESHIMELQHNAAQQMDEEEQWRASLLAKQHEHETQLLEAEDSKNELVELLERQKASYASLERKLEQERGAAAQQVEQMKRLNQDLEGRLDSAETETKRAFSKQDNALKQAQQREERAMQMADDRVAQSMALLDERAQEIRNLKTVIDDLRATIAKNDEGAEDIEEEIEELHSENDELRQQLHSMQEGRTEMRNKLRELQADHDKVSGLQMELHMLQEARQRDRAQKQSEAESAETNISKTSSERNEALARVRDLEQQLAAVQADLTIAKSDTERVTTANINLQNALEAFQSEREAEMAILDEQRRESDEAHAAAHAAAIQATNEANEAEMKRFQTAADAAVKNVMEEVNSLEAKVEESRKENIQLRRSLDEAIHRLQTNQEDVIDRALMKNILIDWFAKSGKGKKDVLEVMASVLHFTEEEKSKIHIGEGHGTTLGKVVGAVAAPLPPSVADVEHLEGDTVREKWVNFLMAEAEGEAPHADVSTKNGQESQMNGTS